MLLNLGSCRKCNGDLVNEGDEWRCLQCGTYYYPQAQSPPEPAANRKPWGINASIRATQSSEARWRSSNRDIIALAAPPGKWPALPNTVAAGSSRLESGCVRSKLNNKPQLRLDRYCSVLATLCLKALTKTSVRRSPSPGDPSAEQ